MSWEEAEDHGRARKKSDDGGNSGSVKLAGRQPVRSGTVEMVSLEVEQLQVMKNPE